MRIQALRLYIPQKIENKKMSNPIRISQLKQDEFVRTISFKGNSGFDIKKHPTCIDLLAKGYFDLEDVGYLEDLKDDEKERLEYLFDSTILKYLADAEEADCCAYYYEKLATFQPRKFNALKKILENETFQQAILNYNATGSLFYGLAHSKEQELSHFRYLLDNKTISNLLSKGTLTINAVSYMAEMKPQEFKQLKSLLANKNVIKSLNQNKTDGYSLYDIAQSSKDEFDRILKALKNDKLAEFLNLNNLADIKELSSKEQSELIGLVLDDGIADFEDGCAIVSNEKTKAKYEELVAKGFDKKHSSIMANMEYDNTDEEMDELLGSINAKEKSPKRLSKFLPIYLKQRGKTDLSGLIAYIKSIDFSQLALSAPLISLFSPLERLKFADYHNHMKNNANDEENLVSPISDITSYFEDDCIIGEWFDNLYTFHPLTSRRIGKIPTDWKEDITQNDIDRIYDLFQGFSKNENISNLANELSDILNKKVKVDKPKIGSYGKSYKISIEGAKEVCLKIFREIEEDVEDSNHGVHVEPQIALFANKHSNDYVKMYFGCVAPLNLTDGFMVTQFLNDDITPENTNGMLSKGYSLEYLDMGDNNYINGKIIDFGGISVMQNGFSM